MPAPFLSPYLLPILLLVGSNVFMTTAWYWHLRFKEVPLFTVILISWGLAFIKYPGGSGQSLRQCRLHVGPAQDHAGGHTLLVFAGFSAFYLREPMTWNYAVGFALIAAGAFRLRGPLH